MSENRYVTPLAILKKAEMLVKEGKPLGEIIKSDRFKSGKGAIGQIIEEGWFGYRPNNRSEPDFPEAGVELKVAPYKKNREGVISAKERLSITAINYVEESKKDFETSAFWHKCKMLLIMLYEYERNKRREDYVIRKVFLFKFSADDLVIIKQDWEIIHEKIINCQGNQISEADTLYLAASTKGRNGNDTCVQANGEMARRRAYSLKASYMTIVIRNIFSGADIGEHIIKGDDGIDLKSEGFEGYLIKKTLKYRNSTQNQLKKEFGIDSTPKNLDGILVDGMFGLHGRIEETSEFRKAGISLRTVRVRKNGTIKEDFPFPAFKSKKIIKEEWETSNLKRMLDVKFMLAIFRETDDGGEYYFDKIMLWNMPYDDLMNVKKVWEQTVEIIREGVVLREKGNKTYNNLPKKRNGYIAHVRSHAQDSSDCDTLPDGRKITKQGFWLNHQYMESVIGDVG